MQSDFPIDAVFTWVDNSDPNWQKSKEQCIQKLYPSTHSLPSGTRSGRFCNRDELRYALRSLALYAPFFRHIYIVTDNQIPTWLNTNHPQIKCVNHDDIFPSHVARPCFNSNVIQTYLYRIQGLAEHFVIFDDDILLSAPTKVSDFFTPQGDIIFYKDTRRFDYRRYSLHYLLDKYVFSNVISSSQYTAQLLFEKTGFAYVHRLAHTPHALTKTLMQKVIRLFKNYLLCNDTYQFRSAYDIKVTCALAQYYAYHNKQAVMRMGYQYLDYYSINWFPMSFIITPWRLRSYQKREQRKLFFSVNDSTPTDNHRTTLKAVSSILSHLMPHASPYEK